MKLDLRLERTYRHPIDKIWVALTDPKILARWLMENDFLPEVGHRFVMRGQAVPGWRGWVECEVLELVPPHRMVWSWKGTDVGDVTRVVVELAASGGGTRLTLAHQGNTDEKTGDLLASGWPGKLDLLGQVCNAV